MRLLSDGIFMSFARIATFALAAAQSVVTARALGPEGRGAFALPAIDVSLAATFVLGLSSGISYFLLNRRGGRSVLRAAIAAAAVATLAGALLTVAVAACNGHLWAAIPALFYLPSFAVLSLVSGYCIGRDRIRHWGLVNVATSAVTILLVLAGFAIFGRTAAVAIAAWVAGTFIVALVGAVGAFASARSLANDAIGFGEFLRYAGKAGALNVATLLNYRIDVYIVAALAPLSVLGMYTIAVAGAESALALTHTASIVTAPRIGKLDRNDAREFVARCSRNSLFVALVACAIAAVAVPWAVRILFGPAYEPIVPALRVLLVGVVALSVGGVIANYFMLNAGRAGVPLSTAVLSIIVCAALSLALVPRLGMLGAAIATATAYVVGQTVAIAAFCRETGLHPARVLLVNGADLAFYRRAVLSLRTRHA